MSASKRLLPTEKELAKMRTLNERFKDRKPPTGWQEEIGAPAFLEDRIESAKQS